MSTKEFLDTLGREMRQHGYSDFGFIVGDGQKCYVKGPLHPSTLEAALLVMGSHSEALRKTINRARTRLYIQLQKEKQKGGSHE